MTFVAIGAVIIRNKKIYLQLRTYLEACHMTIVSFLFTVVSWLPVPLV